MPKVLNCRKRRNRAFRSGICRSGDGFPTIRVSHSRFFGPTDHLECIAAEHDMRRERLRFGKLQDNLCNFDRIAGLVAPNSVYLLQERPDRS